MRGIPGYVAVGLLILSTGCTSIPPPSERESSEYTLFWHNDSRSGGKAMAIIEPIDGLEGASAKVWYVNTEVLDQFPVQIKDGKAYVEFLGHFTQWAKPYAKVKIWTKNDEVHEFDIGDPYVEKEAPIHGTKYALK